MAITVYGLSEAKVAEQAAAPTLKEPPLQPLSGPRFVGKARAVATSGVSMSIKTQAPLKIPGE